MYGLNEDGTASLLGSGSAEASMMTLAGTVIHRGVIATAFDRPMKAEIVGSSDAWLKSGEFLPDGVRTSGRICAEDGHLIHPPRLHFSRKVSPLPEDPLAWRMLHAWAMIGMRQDLKAVIAIEAVLEMDPDEQTLQELHGYAQALGDALPASLADALGATGSACDMVAGL